MSARLCHWLVTLASLLSPAGLVFATPEASNSQEIEARRTSLQYATETCGQGTQVLVETAEFSDGSTVRDLAAFWLTQEALPVEVVLLNTVTLETRSVQLATTHENLFPKGRCPEVRPTGVNAPYEETLRTTPAEKNKKLCTAQERIGFAHLLSDVVHTSPLDEKPETAPFFAMGQFVCVTLN